MIEPSTGRFTGNAATVALVENAFVKYGLRTQQLAQLANILSALERDELAPTTVRAPEQALGRHLADALSALAIDCVKDSRQLADLGSGAGFPGVVLAVALPQAKVSLVESQRRKCAFLERLLAHADIENASIVCARTEEWEAGRSRNDL